MSPEKLGGLKQLGRTVGEILKKTSDALDGRDRKEELRIMKIIANPTSITVDSLVLYKKTCSLFSQAIWS